MPLPRFATNGLAVIALAAALGSTPALAQSAPTDIPGVLTVCAPVISEEYDGNRDRWGQCVAAVASFLDFIGAPSPETDDTVADLVVELAELYRDDLCRLYETELPQAIQLASQKVVDEDQKLQIIEISATITDCEVFATAAIPTPASPF